MRDVLYVLLAVLLLAAVAVGGLWYAAYGVSEAPPARAEVPGLEQQVELAWNDAGVATVRAGADADRYAALGYAHGAERGWLVALLRQTATGRLGEWFGEDLLPLDRLARRLGFAALARQAYAALPDDDRALLEAYTGGMNAALSGRAVQNRSEFALLGRTPAPWKPWHTLAVERLYAYLATAPPAVDSLRGPDSTTAVPQQARAFLRADSMLRQWLHLHDFQQSAAWAVRDSAATHLFYRNVYGSSAVPPLQAVLFQRAGQPNTLGVSLPGTPFLLAGRAGKRAWALLPAGRLEIARARPDSVAATHERILDAEGDEHLVTIRRSAAALLLGTPPAPSAPAPDTARALASDTALVAPPDSARVDSLWQVRWAGFRPTTDLESWQALARGEAPSFELLRGGGLLADSSGAFQLFGQPGRAISFPNGVVAGPPRWTPFLADQVQARLQESGRIQPAAWLDADSSAWAARLAPQLLASIDSLSRTRRGTFTYEERTDIFGRAILYLRNWDFSYDRASIGASIFDTWVAAYRRQTGRLPGRPTPDSLARQEDRRRFRLLNDAVSSLAKRYGNDLENWRWEEVAPDTRGFPGWSDSLTSGRLRRLARTRYAPITLPGGGHPSTLAYGASPLGAGPPAPAAYEAWISTDRWQTLNVRRRRFDPRAPFGRYRTPRLRPDPLALRLDAEAVRTTTLVPAARSDSSAQALRAGGF